MTLKLAPRQAYLFPPAETTSQRASPLPTVHIAVDDAGLQRSIHAALADAGCFTTFTGAIGHEVEADVRILCHESRERALSATPLLSRRHGHVAAKKNDDGGPRIARLLIVGAGNGEESLFAAICAGAWGYVPEDASAAELVRAVKQLVSGVCPILALIAQCPAAASLLMERLECADSAAEARGPSPLTKRQREILRGVVRGETSNEIAERLNLRVQTVKNHIGRILEKTGTQKRAQAAAAAVELGWLAEPE